MKTPGEKAVVAFIAHVLQNGLSSAERIQKSPDETLMRRHRLGPIACQLGMRNFRSDFMQSAAAAARWEEVRTEVLGELVEYGVAVCLLKGASYVEWLYPDPALRPMGDLDILVRPEMMERASEVLVRLGFHAREGKEFMFAPSHHAMTFDRGEVSVDLHRSMTQAMRSHIDLDAMWRRAKASEHRLDVVDEITMHLAHMARHELMVPINTYIDLSLLLRSGPSQSQVLQRCDEFRLGRGARAALAMMEIFASERVDQRPGMYPMPSAWEVLCHLGLPRNRQIVVKGMMLDGPKELWGLAYTTFQERRFRWRSYM